MSRRPADRAAQNQQTIKSLLKLESNKHCADCKRNKHPRWARWSLGIFVCIRCSGIHRGMGTHISRVKSVDLDAWTDEQLQSVLKWGNARANRYWEAKLQPGHVPSDAKIENFIRTKYESKRWVMDGGLPDPATLGGDGDDDDVPLNLVQKKVKLDRSASQRTGSAPGQPPPPPKQAQPAFDLIGGDDVLTTPPARPSTTDPPASKIKPPPAKPPPQTSSQLLGGLGGDFFGGGQPERPASATAKPGGMSRPDLKQSILSLYAAAPKPQSQPAAAPQGHDRQPSFGGPPPAGATPKPSDFSDLNSAFSGLSFGAAAGSPAPSAGQTPQLAQSAKPSPFAGLGPPSASNKSTPAAPQISSPLGGGGFFDTGPKPPPKPAAPTKTASIPPPLTVRKTSNASDSFGEFSAAVNPLSASSMATSANGLLDLGGAGGGDKSQPSTAGGRLSGNPVAAGSSIFNLSGNNNKSGNGGGGGALKAPPNYNALAQTSAPPTKSSFAGLGMADPWGGANAWADPAPAPAGPAPAVASPVSSGGGGGANDFGWGSAGAAKAPAVSAGGSGGWGAPSPPAKPPADWGSDPWGSGGGGGAPKPAPRVTAEEDFDEWGSAPAPAATAVGGLPKRDPGKLAKESEDLWSNVWQ